MHENCPAHPDAIADTTDDYCFDRLTTRHVLGDMRFSWDAKRPGDMVSDATVTTLAADPVTLRQFARDRPLLLVTGSLTCPMTASAIPHLNEMYRRFGDRVAFAQLSLFAKTQTRTFCDDHRRGGTRHRPLTTRITQ